MSSRGGGRGRGDWLGRLGWTCELVGLLDCVGWRVVCGFGGRAKWGAG